MDVRILIVDDEPAIRKLLAKILEAAGYECHTVGDVAAAKEKLASINFDLLLSDLKMPKESGLDLLKFAKKNFPQTGRIMITAFGDPEIASEIMAVGVYGYIIKPVTKNVVLIAVENALRHLRLDLHMHACKVELERVISDRTEKLTTIMNNLNVGVVLLSPDMGIVEMNRKMQEWFPDVSPGKKTPCYHAFKSPQRESICDDCPMAITFETGKTSETIRSIPSVFGEREFRVVTSPIFDKSGKIYAGIALYEDVTEKLLLERNLAQAQKFEAVGQLAAGIAHEINSPVQYIGANISFLKDSFKNFTQHLNTYDQLWQELTNQGLVSPEMDQKLANGAEDADIAYISEEIPNSIDQSLDGVRRIEKIVRAMREFSHPGNEEKTIVDINRILDSTITVCRNEWKYVADIETDLASDLPAIPCFVGEISQVFLNIIVNGAHAIGDFNKDGSKGKGKILIETDKTANGIQIRIGDTGGGIPEKIQKQVFDPFFTTKVQGKGTGQGLAIARRVIDKHQGRLCFETNIGRGTTFIIEIPAEVDEAKMTTLA